MRDGSRKTDSEYATLFTFFAVITLSFVSQAYARPDNKVLSAVKACAPKARELLQQLVQIDSGTMDLAGIAAVVAILKTELEGLGANVESVTPSAPGVADNLVATLTGTGRMGAKNMQPISAVNAMSAVSVTFL